MRRKKRPVIEMESMTISSPRGRRGDRGVPSGKELSRGLLRALAAVRRRRAERAGEGLASAAREGMRRSRRRPDMEFTLEEAEGRPDMEFSLSEAEGRRGAPDMEFTLEEAERPRRRRRLTRNQRRIRRSRRLGRELRRSRG